MLKINFSFLALILLLVCQIDLTAGGRHPSAIADTNPCPHLNNNDPFQRVLEEVDGPGGYKILCCLCERNHKFIGPCKKGRFASTICAACEPGSEINKNFHFDKKCVSKPKVAPTTVSTAQSTRDVEMQDRIVTKASKKTHALSKPAMSDNHVKESSVTTTAVSQKNTARLTTTSAFMTDWSEGTTAAPPYVNGTNKEPGPSLEEFLVLKWIVCAVITLLGTCIFGLISFICWRSKKKKQGDRSKTKLAEEKESPDQLERGASISAHFTVKASAREATGKLSAPGINQEPNEVRQPLLHSRQDDATAQPCIPATENQDKPRIAQNSTPSTEAFLKDVIGEPEQSEKNGVLPLALQSDRETNSQVADNVSHPELEIRKMRKFFSTVAGKHVSFECGDALRFGREFDLTEAELLKCQTDSHNRNRSAGEMMVHVIDAVHGARGSDFTFSSVIEYFRENQILLLVEKLVDHMRC